ncbi:MAG TPA: hypothetical protein VK590_08005 [Saprospiraceae bacterium]|nr:hypothetical protein [Saprospiraceae bacterium]
MAIDIPVRQPRNIFETETGNEKILNALSKQALENKYYGPNIESEINNRNALTEGQNIHNKYLPDEYRLANQLNQQKFEWNPRNWTSENASRNAEAKKINEMLPLEIEKMKVENQFRPQSEQARINYQNMGGGRGSVEQKDLAALNNQLQIDNPIQTNENQQQYAQRISSLSDAYGSGSTILPDGTSLKPLSWRAQQIQNSIMNRNIPVAARNQLINMDSLVQDMNDFDIDAVASFAGPKGKANLIKAQAQMAVDPDDPSIDPKARRYLSAMKQSIINMDQMRKSFGTSVVPEYVYNTIGKLTNPNDSIWNDKTQVKKAYNDVLKTMSKNRDLLRSKYRGGLNSSIVDNSSSNNIQTAAPKATLRYNQQTGNFEEIM